MISVKTDPGRRQGMDLRGGRESRDRKESNQNAWYEILKGL